MKFAALFVLVTCLSAAATYVGVAGIPSSKHATQQPRYELVSMSMPSAREFGRALVGTANQFGPTAQIAHPDCVQAAPGRYMCSYAVVTKAGRECHIMQGRWTPDAASTITVTMAGRTLRCGSLRAAIQSLG